MYVVDDSVAIGELVALLKNSIWRAAALGSFDGPEGLEVVSARLTLSVMASRDVGGGVNFRIPVLGTTVSLGAKTGKQHMHTLDLVLVPGWDDTAELRDGEVEDTVVDAISTIYALMVGAAKGDQQWLLESGTIDVSFAVSESGSITLGIDGAREDGVTQTLRLSFGPRRTAGASERVQPEIARASIGESSSPEQKA